MQARDVLRLFPEIIARTSAVGTPFAALTDTMAFLLHPADVRLSHLDAWFDAYRAPSAMIPYLAGWVDLAWLPMRTEAGGEGIPVERLRALMIEAPRLAATRGTRAGLKRFLEVALHEPDVNVIDHDPGRPFHLIVEVPRRIESMQRLAELIVQFEKPAHLTHEVRIV